MTTTSATSSVQTVAPTIASAAASAAKGLGKQDFLKLLMAQLQNQDPLKPMDDSAMIAQMATFSALEATQALNATMQNSTNLQTVSQTGALIGKYIQATSADGIDTTGAVTGVNFTTTDGVVAPTLEVNGRTVDYSTIQKISSTPITGA
jgi:flagellar basal-body rod modification protein FlgD